MVKILAYPLTAVYYLCFFTTLLVFHPIQWVSHNVFGYQTHKISVDWMQFFIMRSLNVLGTRFSFKNDYNIPKGQPVIIVANHQSMYDIPPLIWFMRKHHPKFISKIELGKGIPSVSYNLRHGGSVLIDRKNPRQSFPAISNFGEYIERTKRCAVIFPEGTRSKTGEPKPFQTKGLAMLFKKIPSAVVVPVTINNSWKMFRYGKFPMGIGTHMKFKVQKPVYLSDYDDTTALIDHIEKTVKKDIHP